MEEKLATKLLKLLWCRCWCFQSKRLNNRIKPHLPTYKQTWLVRTGPALLGWFLCLHVHHSSSRLPASGKGTTARRAVRELGAAGLAVTPSLTQKQRGIFTLEYSLKRNSPREIQSCGTHTNNMLTHSIWVWNGPSDRDGGPALPAPKDKQQTAHGIPNIFSSN